MFLPLLVEAQTTYYSRATGNWSDVNTWSTDAILQHGGAAAATVPGSAADDIVLIGSGHNVTVNQSATFETLTIDDDAGGGTLTYRIQNVAPFNAALTLTVTGNLTINSGGTVILSQITATNVVHVLEVQGNIANAGVLNLFGTSTATTRRVDLRITGGGNTVISGAGTFSFQTITGVITFNKSSISQTITNTSSWFDPTGYATWTAGTYIHNTASTTRFFAQDAARNLTNAAFQIDQGTVELYTGNRNNDYDITFGGDFTVNGGTVIVGNDLGGAEVGDLIVTGTFTMSAGTVRAGIGDPSGPTYSTDGEIVLNGSATISGGTIWTDLFWVAGTANISGAGTVFQARQLDVQTTGNLTFSQLTANVGVSGGTDGLIDIRGAAAAPRGILTVNNGATLNHYSDGDAAFQIAQAGSLVINNADVIIASDAIDNDDALEVFSGTDASNQTTISISNGGTLTVGTGTFGDWEDDGLGNFISISVDGAGSALTVNGTGAAVIVRDLSITAGGSATIGSIVTVGNNFTVTGASTLLVGSSTAERLLTTNGTVSIGTGSPVMTVSDWTLGNDAVATVTGGTITVGYNATNTGNFTLTGQASAQGASISQSAGTLTVYGNAAASLEILEGSDIAVSGTAAWVISPNATNNNDVARIQRSLDGAFPTTLAISGGADVTIGTGTFGDFVNVTANTFIEVSVTGAGSTLTANGIGGTLDVRSLSVTTSAVVALKNSVTVNTTFTLTNAALTTGNDASLALTINGTGTIGTGTTTLQTDDLTIGADGNVTVSSGTITVGHVGSQIGTLFLTGEASAQGAILTMSGGTITVHGQTDGGTFEIREGADLSLSGTASVVVAPAAASNNDMARVQGTVDPTHPTTITISGGADLTIGTGTFGDFTNVTSNQNINISLTGSGSTLTSYGTGGTLAINTLSITSAADALFGNTVSTIAALTLSGTGSSLQIGQDSGETLTLNGAVTIGTGSPALIVDRLVIGADGHLTLTNSATVQVGHVGTKTGVVQMLADGAADAGGQLTLQLTSSMTVYSSTDDSFDMQAAARLTMSGTSQLVIAPGVLANFRAFTVRNGTAGFFTTITMSGGADVVVGNSSNNFGRLDDNGGGVNVSISVSGSGTTFNAYGTAGTCVIGQLTVGSSAVFNINNSMTVGTSANFTGSAQVTIGDDVTGTLTMNGAMNVTGASTLVVIEGLFDLNSSASVTQGTLRIAQNNITANATRFDLAAAGSLSLNANGTITVLESATSVTGGNICLIDGSISIDGGIMRIGESITSYTGGNLWNQRLASSVSLLNGSILIGTDPGLTTVTGGGNAYNLTGTSTLTLGDGNMSESATLSIMPNLAEQLPLTTPVNVMDIAGTGVNVTMEADAVVTVGGANRGDVRFTAAAANNFTINGGTLNVTASLSLASGATFTVNDGTVNLGTNASDGTNTITYPGDPTLPVSFVVNGGTVTIGDGNSSVTMGDGDNNPTIASGNYHRFEINNGTVNLNGRFDMNDRAARFIITGGTLDINPQGDQDIGGNNNVLRLYRGAAEVTGGIITLINPNPNAGGDGATSGLALLVRTLGDGTTTDARLHNGTGGGITSTFTGSDIRFGNGVASETGSTDGFDLLLANDFTYSNITVNNPTGSNRHVTVATLPANSTLTIPNLTITAGTFQIGTAATPTSPNVLVTGTGNFVLGAGGTIRIANTTNSAVPGGNPVNFPYGYASYSIGAASTIEYSGNGSAIVGLPSGSGETIENLTLSGTGTKALTAFAQSINGTLRLTSGTFNVGTLLTLNNGATVLRDGTDLVGIIGTGTLQQANATDLYTIRYEGVSKTTQTGEWVTGGTPGISDLYINLTAGQILTLNASRTVRDLNMNSGNFADGGFSLEVNRHLTGTSNSTHTGTGDIEITGGAATHNFTGTINVEDLTLNDAAFNVDMQTGAILNVGGILTFTAGNIELGDDLVTFDLNASIAGTPSATSMIVTTGSTAQSGVQKTMQAGVSFTFPIGTGAKYTPASITVTAAFSSGPVTVKPVSGGEHPVTQDLQNKALNYYWLVSFTGMSAVTDATLSLVYDATDLGVDGVETLYVPARYSPGVNPWSIAGTTAGVLENTPVAGRGTINFSNVGYLSGAFTAGESSEFNNATVVNYYSLGGVWDEVTSWSTAGYGGAAAASLPAANTPVFIGDNKTITVDAGGATTISALTIESSGILDVEVIPVTTFGTVGGTGTMRLHGNTFPTGTFASFLNTGGGTVEYRGAGNYTLPASITNYNNLSLTGSGTTKTFPNADLQLYGHLSVSGGVTALLSNAAGGNLNIDGNLTVTGASTILRYQNTTARSIIVDGSVTVSTSATFDVTNAAGVANTLTIGSTTASSGNLTVTNATFQMLNGTGYVDVTFAGTQDATLSVPSGGAPDPVAIFNRLIVNKGTSTTPLLNVNCANTAANAFVISGSNSGATKALELQNGTFQISASNVNGTVDGQNYAIDLATGGGDFIIPATAGLRISGGAPVVLSSSGGDDLTLNGALTVDGTGTFILGTITSGLVANSLKYSSTTSALTLGGTAVMTVSTGVRANGTAALVYTQTGGTLTVGRYGRETGEPTFEITTHANSQFNMSDGLIVAVRGGTNDSESTQILSATNVVSGGTLQITNANSPVATNHRVRLRSPIYNLTIPLTTYTGTVDFNTYDVVVQNDFTLNVAAGGRAYFQDGEDLTVQGTLNLTTGVLTGTNLARTLSVHNYNQTGGTFSLLGTNVASNLNISGNFSKSSGTLTLPTNIGTTTFNGSATPQTVSSDATLTFNNVVLNNSAPAGVIQLVNCDLNVTGNWTTTAGDLDAQTNARTVTFNSSTAAQTITGTTNFYNLTINNTFGTNTVTLVSGILGVRTTVGSGGTLTFTAGFLVLGDNSLIIRNTDASAISGASGAQFIRMGGTTAALGVTKYYPEAASDFTFPIGVGTDYTPARINSTNHGTSSGHYIRVRVIDAVHPVATAIDALSRYWDVDGTNWAGAYTFDNEFTYVDADIHGGGDDATYVGAHYIPTNWTSAGDIVTEGSNLVSFTGLTFATADFTAGDLIAFGLVTTYYSWGPNGTIGNAFNWGAPTNDTGTSPWSGAASSFVDISAQGAPTAASPVVIQRNHTVTITVNTISTGDLSFDNADGTVTLALGTTTGHNFGTVSGPGVIQLASGTLPGGTYTDFNADGGIFEFTGAGAYTIPTGTYRNLVVSGAGVKTAGGTLTVQGDLTISSGSTLDLDANTANRSTAGGTMTMETGATLLLSGANNFPTNYSSYSLHAASQVTYDANIAQQIAARTYGNLTLTTGATVTKTLAGPTVINGNLTLTRTAGNPVFATGNHALSIAGNIAIGQTQVVWSSGTSTITMNGTGAQTITRTGGGALSMQGLTINNAAGVSITTATAATNLTVTGILTLTSGPFSIGGAGAVANSLTLSGTVSTAAGTITGGNLSDLTLSGTGAVGTISFTAGGRTIRNFVMNRAAAGSVIIGSDLAIGTAATGTMTLTAGTVDMAANTLTINRADTDVFNGANGSTSSYIDGRLAITYPAAGAGISRRFPVAQDGLFRPVTISGSPVSAVIRVEVVNSAPTVVSKESALVTISTIRYFNVRLLAGTFNNPSTITMFFNVGNEDESINDPGDLRVARSTDNSNWTSIAGSGSFTAKTNPNASPGTKAAPEGSVTSGSSAAVVGDTYYAVASATNDNPLPIELADFAIKSVENKTVLAWTTLSEIDHYGFFIDRKWSPFEGSTIFQASDTTWQEVHSLLGNGASYEEKSYEFIDEGVTMAGKYTYRLKQKDFNGVTTIYGPYEFEYQKPVNNELLPNYPNPFNPETVIPFSLSDNAKVLIQLYDLTGRKVMDVANRSYAPGRYRVSLNAARLSSGIYLVRMVIGNDVKTRKITLIR